LVNFVHIEDSNSGLRLLDRNLFAPIYALVSGRYVKVSSELFTCPLSLKIKKKAGA